MKRLRYAAPVFGGMPRGDIAYMDKRGRVAEPFEGDDPEERMEFELAGGRYAHVGDQAKRFDPFIVKRHEGLYLVVISETDTASFATLKEAIRHGISRRGPFRLLRDTQ